MGVLGTELTITLMQECLPGWTQILAALVAIVLTVVCFYYNVKATAVNTEDPAIEIQREHLRSQVYFDPVGMAADGTDLHLWCQLCSTYVNESSKHCGACNRCTYEFDHHCNWLNTCVGATNYRDFYKLIWTFLFFLVWFLVMAGYGIFVFRSNSYAVMIISGEMVVGLVGLGALIDLIVMHRWLQAKNMTTFEYIIYSREKRKTLLEVKVRISSNFFFCI